MILCSTWLSTLNHLWRCSTASFRPSAQLLGTVGEYLTLLTASWPASSEFQSRLNPEILQPVVLCIQSRLCIKPLQVRWHLHLHFIYMRTGWGWASPKSPIQPQPGNTHNPWRGAQVEQGSELSSNAQLNTLQQTQLHRDDLLSPPWQPSSSNLLYQWENQIKISTAGFTPGHVPITGIHAGHSVSQQGNIHI